MTLGDIIALVQKADLTAIQKRDQVSAIRTVARLLGAAPDDIDADPRRLRLRLEAIAPEAIGLSKGRWANLRSLMGKALEHGRVMMPSRRVTPISSSWLVLLDQLDKNRRTRLSAISRHFSNEGIEPSAVTLEHLLDYRQRITEDRLRRSPEKTWDAVLYTWNITVREIAGWPQVSIPREDKRERYVFDWSAFPESLKTEVDAFLRRQSGADLSEDGPPRPLRASSLATRERQLRMSASALAHAGVDRSEVRSIADFVSLENFKLILRFFLDRRDGATSTQIGQIAAFLKSVAEHWVKVDDLTLLKLKRLVSRLSTERRGMTEKNRDRLRPFDDPETVLRFLRLPEAIRTSISKSKAAPRSKAIQAQCAAAITILQAAPIRLGNLASIDFNKHLIERNGRVYLVVAADEVKNREPIDLELPASVIEVLSWYATEHRPILVNGKSTALFPGEKGGPKQAQSLGQQISREVFRHTGLKINPHLFRHVAGKIFLDQRPGQYEVVRRLLGHKSIATTTAIYTGAESRAAGHLFASVVDDLRSGAIAASPAKNQVRSLTSGRGK
jgi:integrase